jgi:hypothetical protein
MNQFLATLVQTGLLVGFVIATAVLVATRHGDRPRRRHDPLPPIDRH